jgi:hypothetical protein
MLVATLALACVAPACGSEGNGDPPPAQPNESLPPGSAANDPKPADPSSEGGPTDADPDGRMDPNAPSPEDDPTLPPATQLELAKTFAPHLNLHPSDAYRPANVDWYLSRVTMRFHHNDCPDHELLGLGKVTQQTLIAQSHEDNKSFCQHDSSKKVTSTASDHFFLQIANDDVTRKGAPRADWKTYVVWRPKTGGLVDVEYWFFYPWNDGFTIFNHESDWEHVRVTIDPKANGAQGRALEVKLSAHKGGTIAKADEARVTWEATTHVVSYVAKGTHANYLKPGTYDIEGTQGVAKDEAKAAAAPADVWQTESSLVLVGTRAAPKNGQVFVKYWGRWGELGDLPETNGVTRHFP